MGSILFHIILLKLFLKLLLKLFLNTCAWRRKGTDGWRVASRTLGQGFEPLRCRIAPRIRSQGLEPHMSNQGTLEHRYWDPHSKRGLHLDHKTKTIQFSPGQDTRECASLAQSFSHRQPPLTLPITGRRGHMVVRQLKLWEGLIKPEPWRMQT
jgi:hypothetical protein